MSSSFERSGKTKQLKKDVEIISQNHERDVDRKDAILQMSGASTIREQMPSHRVNLSQCPKRKPRSGMYEQIDPAKFGKMRYTNCFFIGTPENYRFNVALCVFHGDP